MRKLIALLTAFLFFAAAPNAPAQHGSGTHYPAAGHNSPTSDSRRTLMMPASDDQRMALAMCTNAGESVRKITDKMVGPGTRWRYEDKTFRGQEERLRIALAVLAASHEQFRGTLSEEQAKEIAKRLAKLDRLHREVLLALSELDEALTDKHPDPRRVYAEAHKIKEVAEHWGSEHKKIAKEMGIQGQKTRTV
jgi:hypothetical protein